jgi:hypothetical protein
MLSKLLYYAPRFFTILIATIVFAFLTEALDQVTRVMTITGYGISLLGASIVVFLSVKTKKDQLLALLPVAYWLSLFVVYIMGGFNAEISFIQFIFLSLVAGITTFLSFFSWTNSQLGGSLYVALGVIYIFIAFNRVEMVPLIIVLGSLLITGILLYLTPTAPQDNNSDQLDEPKNSENPPVTSLDTDSISNLREAEKALKGWQSMARENSDKTRTFKNTSK